MSPVPTPLATILARVERDDRAAALFHQVAHHHGLRGRDLANTVTALQRTLAAQIAAAETLARMDAATEQARAHLAAEFGE